MEEILKLRKLHESYGHDNHLLCTCGKIKRTLTLKMLGGLPIKNLATIQYLPPKNRIFILTLLILLNKEKVVNLIEYVDPLTKYFIEKLLKEMEGKIFDPRRFDDLPVIFWTYSYIEQNNYSISYHFTNVESILNNLKGRGKYAYFINRRKDKYISTNAILRDFVKPTIKPTKEGKYKNKINLILDNPYNFQNWVLSKKKNKPKEKTETLIKIKEFKYNTISNLSKLIKSDIPERIKAFIFSYLYLTTPQKIIALAKKINNPILNEILTKGSGIEIFDFEDIISKAKIIKTESGIYKILIKHQEPLIKLYKYLYKNKENYVIRTLVKNMIPKFTKMDYNPRAKKIQDLILPDSTDRYDKLINILKEKIKGGVL